MATQEVMTVQQPQQFNQSDLDLLKRTIAPGTTNDQFDLFVQICQRVQLDPFARQIYCILRTEYNRETRMKESRMTTVTSIDGYRVLAQRSGEYEGQDGPYYYDAETKEWTDVWVKDTPPAAAKVGVLRKGFKNYLYATARFESYVARSYNTQTQKYDGPAMNLWGKMPEVMIAKVAEGLALRRAFPAELSGLYTKEEMDQAGGEALPTVSVQPVVQPAPDEPPPVEVSAEVVDVAPPAPTPTQPAKPPAPAKKLSVVKPAPKQRDTQPLDGTVPEPPQDEQPPAPQVDEAGIKSRLDNLLRLGQMHGKFTKMSDLARYARRILGRPLSAEQFLQMSETDLTGVEAALLSEIGAEFDEAEKQAVAS